MPALPKNSMTREEFIRNLYEAEWLPVMPGIRGRAGVRGLPPGLGEQVAHLGIDLLDMQPGTAFPLHVHPGAHILFILEGRGTVTIGETVFETKPGDCYFIPGDLDHGVGAIERHQLLSIGFPHKALDDPERMTIVDSDYLGSHPMMAQMYSGDDLEARQEALQNMQSGAGHSHSASAT